MLRFQETGGIVLDMEQDYPEMLVVNEVADLFEVTPTTVRRWARTGVIQHIRPFGKYLFPRDQPMIAVRLNIANGKETAPSEEVDNASAHVDSDGPETE